MRFLSLLPVLLLVAVATVSPPDPGEEIFDDVCAGCHTLLPPPDLGPPLFDVVDRYLAITPTRKDARASLIAWIADPENQPPAMPDSVVAEYGEMPDFGLTPEQVTAVTDWLLRQYDAQEK